MDGVRVLGPVFAKISPACFGVRPTSRSVWRRLHNSPGKINYFLITFFKIRK